MERELDHRKGDGIDVTLLWDDDVDAVLVAVENEHTGDVLRIAVERADALDAFHHPFAFARRGSRKRGLAASSPHAPASG
jgi:hypothetical protein